MRVVVLPASLCVPDVSRAVHKHYETQMELDTGLRISERPSQAIPTQQQTLSDSVMYPEPEDAVQLCVSFRGCRDKSHSQAQQP